MRKPRPFLRNKLLLNTLYANKLGLIKAYLVFCLSLFSVFNTHSIRAAESAPIAIIVAHDFFKNDLSITDLKLIYWRKKTYWANGQRMHPVNLPPTHPLRLQFSNIVLGSPPSAQIDYWNGLYFHGTSPPHVVNSSEAMMRYVQETNGAIGYVNACQLEKQLAAGNNQHLDKPLAIKPIAWLSPLGELYQNAPELNCQ